MTTSNRQLTTPVVQSQTMATRRTARAHHAFALADLANDAATGHPAQRATILRTTGGTFHLYYDPRSTARLLEVDVSVSWRGTWAPLDGVTVDLSITDGTSTVLSSGTDIPNGLKGSELILPSLGSTDRLGSTTHTAFYLDREGLITTGLSATALWRMTLVITCGATVYCENVFVREVARFTVDDAEDFGDLPQNYLPRAPVDDHLARIGKTLESAYDANRRTYHAFAAAEASPLSVTSTSYAAIPGAQSEAVGTAATWRVHPRRIKGETPVQIAVRYRTSGAGAGNVRLHTSGTGSPFVVALPSTSGAWSTAVATGALANAATDDLSWSAKVASGTLEIATLWVADDP